MVQRRTVSSCSEYESVVGYSRAVRTGPHIAVAGTTGGGDGIAAQTREALRRIEIAWQEVGAVHAEVLGDIRPVATMVEVSALISPELLVEIEVDAYREA